MTDRASLVDKTELHRWRGIYVRAALVAIRADYGAVSSCERKLCLPVLCQTEGGRLKILECVATLTAIRVGEG